MQLHYQVYEHLKDLPYNWDQGLHQKHPLHSSKIGVTELSNTPHIRNYYVMAYCADKQLAFQAYGQRLDIQVEHFHFEQNNLRSQSIKLLIKLLKPKLFVAGNLFRHDIHTLHFHKQNWNHLDRAKVLNEAIDFMVKYSQSQGAFVKDIPKSIAKHFVQNNDWIRLKNDISMNMNIPKEWKNFGDYQLALKHKYTQRAKKTRKAFAEVNSELLSLEQIQKQKKQLHALYQLVARNQVVSMGELSDDFLVEMKKSLGDIFQVRAFYHKEKLIAFSSAIVHKGIHDMNYIGFDYKLNKQFALYFNMLFHCVECAIGNQCNKLILGRTALEAKAIIGCEPEYLFTFYKLKNPLIHSVVKRVAKRFEMQLGEGWKDRHPFAIEYYKEASNNI